MIAPVCGGVLRDAQIFLPFGVQAWLPTKPRAKEFAANLAIFSLFFFCLRRGCSFVFHLYLKVHIHWGGISLTRRLSCVGFFDNGIVRRLQDLPWFVALEVHAIIVIWNAFISHLLEHCLIEVCVHSVFSLLRSKLYNYPAGSSSGGLTRSCSRYHHQCDPQCCRSQGQG